MTDKEFEKKKLENIASYVDDLGWSKDKAETYFESQYPDKNTFIIENIRLNALGEQRVIDKINELIEIINAFFNQKEKDESLTEYLKTNC